MSFNLIPQLTPPDVNPAIVRGVAGLNATSIPAVAYRAMTDTSAATLTWQQLLAGRKIVTVNMTGTLGAGAALTLDTVAIVVAAMQQIYGSGVNVAGMSWMLRIINSSSANFAWTLTTATGWGTLGGTQSVAQNTTRLFVVTITTTTSGTIQSVGIGSTS